MEQESIRKEQLTATLYFNTPEDHNDPELLLFEEGMLRPGFPEGEGGKDAGFWRRLKHRFEQYSFEAFAGDRFVRSLRKFKRIKVLLNQPIEPAVVRSKLKQMMRDRSYHHLRWMIIDTLLLPAALFIAPLPGPNVIGYYLLFRVYTHWKSFRSASRTTLEHVEIQVSRDAGEVNALLRKSKDIRSALRELRKKYGLRALQEHQFIPQMEVMKNAWRKLRHPFHH